MDEEEDDFYDPADSVPASHTNNNAQNTAQAQPQESDDMEEEEYEVEEDDDDFNIITEAPAGAPPEISHPRPATLRQETQRPSSADSSIGPKSATPSATPRLDAPTPATGATLAARPAAPQKPGSAYPAIHTSTIDVDANPVHPTTGKPIMLSDMDNDFPADDKPWRRPGTDISDFFNYGFDEFTWVSYCLKQQNTRKDLVEQKAEMERMQSVLGMGMPPMPGAPGPGAPGNVPPAMPPMPGMPDMNPDMMQGMFASMMAQGMDPTSMDPMAFMQHAQSMMGGQPGGGQQGQPGFGGQGPGQGFQGGQGQMGQGQMGYGGGYEQRGNYGGRGRGRRW
ncbi:uncharacterized protein N7477_004373 [Penicillium maclennaniae]|uniref:uncharacterized protein n=1 Tax=Penicillium maclennaniae TaxID=1343394 RepID=UPI002541834F|nr:uncharacterized protein N7477_004373 [Penicillium maclennaniae]KAJ5674439.1 hypothetical protein N7477_004373 [Penicillium maclennaniae]